MRKEKRCIHRHTIKKHPNCFRKGLIDLQDEWWKDKKIGFFDIEVTNLDANWGFMLSWCLKFYKDPKVISDIITKREMNNYTFDKRITGSLLDALEDVDIIVTYYGKRFDVPYVRTRALYYGFEVPKYTDMYHWDIYDKIKRRFKFSRNSLAVATEFFGIPGKTPIPPEVWHKARYGEKKALDYVLEHNVADVEILEDLFEKIKDTSNWTRTRF